MSNALKRWENGEPYIDIEKGAAADYAFGMGIITLTAVGDLVYRYVLEDPKHVPKKTLAERAVELSLWGAVSYFSVRALRQGMRICV